MTNWPQRPTEAPPPAAPLWAALPLPVWVLRPARELVYANAAARELESEGALTMAAGRLMHLGSLSAVALEGLLRLGSTRSPLWLAPSGRTGWLQVTPLPRAAALAAGWPEEARLLCLHLDQPELTHRARVEALCQRVRLSPAERSVLMLLADGLVPQAVARQLGIQLSTARTHVRRLLAKSRAPSLVQLLRWLGSAEPLPG